MEVGERLYLTIINSLDEGVYFVNSKQVISLWNSAMSKISGYEKEEIINRDIYDKGLILYSTARSIINKTLSIHTMKEISRAIEKEGFFVKKNKEVVPVIVKRLPIIDNNHYGGSICIVKDITRLRMDENKKMQLAKLAFQDEITGISSRHYGEMVLNNAIAEVTKRGTPINAISLLISDLKLINLDFGHEFGDSLLGFLGEYFLTKSDDKYFVCRWEGSKFLIIMKDMKESLINIYRKKLKEEIKGVIKKSEYSKAKVKVYCSTTALKTDDTKESVLKRLEEGLKANYDEK